MLIESRHNAASMMKFSGVMHPVFRDFLALLKKLLLHKIGA